MADEERAETSDHSDDSDTDDEQTVLAIDLDELLDFVCPSDTYHQPTLYRLLILAKFGPTVDGKLYGGHMNQHEVSSFELRAMIEQEKREDIYYIFTRTKRYLMPEHKAEILSDPPNKEYEALKMPCRADIEHLLRDVTRTPDGKLHFGEVQAKVTAYHEKIISGCRQTKSMSSPRSGAKQAKQGDFDTTCVFKGHGGTVAGEKTKSRLVKDYKFLGGQ